MDKYVKFPESKAEIAGMVILVVVTMIVASHAPVLKKFV